MQYLINVLLVHVQRLVLIVLAIVNIEDILQMLLTKLV